MATMKAALVALVGGKWKVSYHATLAEAQTKGGNIAELEEGWTLVSIKDFSGITVDQAQSLYNFMAPKPANIGTDLDKATAKVWALVAKGISGANAADPEPDEVQPEEEPELPLADEDNNTTTEDEVQTDTEVDTEPTPHAPARAPARATARAAPKATAKKPAARAAPRAAPAARAAPTGRAAPKAAAKNAAAGNGRAAPKAAAKKAAATRAPREGGVSPEWKKVLADIAKKGDAGVSNQDIAVLCDKHGCRPMFARFVRPPNHKLGGKGYLALVERGRYKITAAGKKAVAA